MTDLTGAPDAGIRPDEGFGRVVHALRLPRVKAPDACCGVRPEDPVSSVKLNARFRDQGVVVDVLDPYGKPWNPRGGAHPVFCGIDPLRSLRLLTRARHYDVVIADYESPALIPLRLRHLFRYRPPIVMIDIGLSRGWKERDKILDVVAPRIDGIIAFGRAQVDHIHARWRTSGLVRFVPMQVDTEFYQPTSFAPNGPILTVGDDIERDFSTLLAAIESLDVDLVARTGQPIQERGSAPRVRRISRRLDWDAYRALLAEARFVVVPVSETVRAGGVGSLLEAMAMGKAVIVSGSVGLRDYLVPGDNALVVPCADPAAMREAVLRLMSDGALCQRLGAGARAFVERYCSFNAHARAVKAVLREVVASHGRGSRSGAADG